MGSELHIIDDTPDEPTPDPAQEDRLNLARIRAITLDRRAAHRRWLWARAMVFVFACLTMLNGTYAARVEGSRRWWFLCGSLGFAVLTIRALRRLPRFAPRPTESNEPPPDPAALERLSDGSQYARGLDALRRDPD